MPFRINIWGTSPNAHICPKLLVDRSVLIQRLSERCDYVNGLRIHNVVSQQWMNSDKDLVGTILRTFDQFDEIGHGFLMEMRKNKLIEKHSQILILGDKIGRLISILAPIPLFQPTDDLTGHLGRCQMCRNLIQFQYSPSFQIFHHTINLGEEAIAESERTFRSLHYAVSLEDIRTRDNRRGSERRNWRFSNNLD